EDVAASLEVLLDGVEEADAAMRFDSVEVAPCLDVEAVDHLVDVGPERGCGAAHAFVVAREPFGQQHHLVLTRPQVEPGHRTPSRLSASHGSGRAALYRPLVSTNQRQEITAWVGWVWFAAWLVGLAGVFQIIAGLVSITRGEDYFGPTTQVAVDM